MSGSDPEGLSVYLLDHSSKVPEECNRLDTLHEAITAYFSGRLSLAPLEIEPPKTILELGAGSGVWTVQAATKFPDAEVLAVDLAEIPRALPPNARFQIADLTKPFEFQPRSFDLIHARLIFINLPNYREVMERAIDLLNPGGWFIIEEVDGTLYDDDDELGPAIKKWLFAMVEVIKSRKIDLRGVRDHESILEGSAKFAEISAHKVAIPISGQTDGGPSRVFLSSGDADFYPWLNCALLCGGWESTDPMLKQLGEAMRLSLNSIIFQLARRLAANGSTRDLAEQACLELNDDRRKLRQDFYVILARKRL